MCFPGSILLLCQPLGSVLSGCVQGVIGRKKSLLFTNVVHLLAWYLLYSAQSVNTLYVASFTMGIGIGFQEAPSLAYLGEISEPNLRSTLVTLVNKHVVLGHLLEFTISWFLPWRQAMLLSCVVPITSMIVILLVNTTQSDNNFTPYLIF